MKKENRKNQLEFLLDLSQNIQTNEGTREFKNGETIFMGRKMGISYLITSGFDAKLLPKEKPKGKVYEATTQGTIFRGNYRTLFVGMRFRTK